MELKEFKKLYRHYTTAEHFSFLDEKYNEYITAMNDVKECSEWYFKQQIKKAGLNYRKYCCLNMGYHMIARFKEVEKLKEDPEYINYDSVVTYSNSQKEYGIPIHDGGSSYIAINFCPWCGTELK